MGSDRGKFQEFVDAAKDLLRFQVDGIRRILEESKKYPDEELIILVTHAGAMLSSKELVSPPDQEGVTTGSFLLKKSEFLKGLTDRGLLDLVKMLEQKHCDKTNLSGVVCVRDTSSAFCPLCIFSAPERSITPPPPAEPS